MRILAVNFFPAFHPPSSGGEQRYYYLYRHLSTTHDVTLLSPTYSSAAYEEVTFSPSFRELRVPKPAALDRIHWELGNAGIGPECSAYVVALGAAVDGAFAEKLAELTSNADIVVHESPFTLPYDRTIASDGKPRVYNAYNVEHRLAAQILDGEAGRKAVEFIYFLERSLTRRASLVLVTSEEERHQIAEDFGVESERIALAPNGFEPATGLDASTLARDDRSVVFMGSAHPPNIEAALYVIDQLAPRLPGLQFHLLGSVCKAITGKPPANVTLLGFVEEHEKNRLLRTCALAINPLSSGAGTNLKMLDYLAAGAPVLTTPVGARGLDLVDRETAFIADTSHFADRLEQVLADQPLREAVAVRGRRYAHSTYEWEAIAASVSRSLQHVLGERFTGDRRPQRPFALVVNDFAVSDPKSGGQVRINALLREIGRTFDVIFLCLTGDGTGFHRSITSSVIEIGIPKTEAHRQDEIARARGEAVSVADIVASRHCAANAAFVEAFRKHATHAAVVVFEHPFLAPMLDFVADGVPVVYSSLNVETDLKEALLRPRTDGTTWSRRAAELEQRMLGRADMIVCVSKEDRDRFKRMRPVGNYVVIANGAYADAVGRAKRATADGTHEFDLPLAVFLGSSHMPNIEAARFIINELAPALPEIGFGIVGSVCDGVRLDPRPPNVGLFGTLPEEEKNAVLSGARCAINPMFGGGGSSLKIPDFLASGLPLISTHVGIRGYSLDPDVDFIAAEPAQFGACVRDVDRNITVRQVMSKRALSIARNELDWRFLGARYRRALHGLVDGGSLRRALVVTYRFADPPPGGAEAYLVNLLKELHRSGRFEVDVATCDVSQLSNHWHFSARYEPPQEGEPRPGYVNAVYRFPVDEPRDDVFDSCRRLFALWMRESREQAKSLRAPGSGPVLGGGWNFVESHGGQVSRWTSLASDVLVDDVAIAMSVGGFSPSRTRLSVLQGERELWRGAVDGRFTIEVELARTRQPVTLRIGNAYRSAGDPRELGVVVDRMDVQHAGRTFQLDLAEDFSTRVRRDDSSAWVASLIDLAERRSPGDDADFLAARGPHSAALERWLDRYVGDYDVVLAHGVPFAPIVVATRAATRCGVPIVLLPHFHLEDRYYHWRAFYDSFRKASAVLASPAQVKAAFLDRIGARGLVVPGGGVDPGEFGELALGRAQRAFVNVHRNGRPFALVLGRKAAGKNYSIAIDSIRLVNATHDMDLVLIGPDEDGIPIAEPRVCFYGSQPREVVVGALASATCVVNMSDSESFGIVLLEAWSAGTPVIAQRNCVAFKELVVDEANGFLADTAADVARAIVAYLTQPDLAKRHAANGRIVAETHSWQHLADRIEEVLIANTRAISKQDATPPACA